jgi:dihydroflavonol-4-reductase
MPVLCRAGYPVRALVRRPSDHPWLGRYPAAEIIQGDILHPQAVERALAGASQVIHAAGAFRFWGQAEAFERTNVGGTHNLLQAAQTAGIAKFVYISTIAVIGNPDPSRIVDETHPAQPADAYQASKLRAEQAVLESAAKGLPALIVRPGAFYGPLGSYAFNRLFFQDPMRGIVMQMDGGRYVIFPAYVPDVAQGILLALERGRPGEIYNLCGDAITHREAFDVVCAYAHIRVPRLSLPGWMGIFTSRLMEGVATLTRREPFYPLNLRSYVYNYWRVSNEKARRELGFSPTDFKTGAHRTIDWYRAGRPSWIPELECDAVTAAHD